MGMWVDHPHCISRALPFGGPLCTLVTGAEGGWDCESYFSSVDTIATMLCLLHVSSCCCYCYRFRYLAAVAVALVVVCVRVAIPVGVRVCDCVRVMSVLVGVCVLVAVALESGAGGVCVVAVTAAAADMISTVLLCILTSLFFPFL